MTMCPNSKKACECQPQDGVMCPHGQTPIDWPLSDDLKVGDRIKDNDPRMPNRVLTIVEILPNGVAAKDGSGRVFCYLRRRIHTDGKPRRSGFKLLRFDA
jgi:hypothetical protein